MRRGQGFGGWSSEKCRGWRVGPGCQPLALFHRPGPQFPHLAGEWAGVRAAGSAGVSWRCFALPRAAAAVGWPVLLSAAGAGRGEETTEGVREVVNGNLPPPHSHPSLWV